MDIRKQVGTWSVTQQFYPEIARTLHFINREDNGGHNNIGFAYPCSQPGNEARFYHPLFNLGCTVDKVVFPEVVAGVLDQLDEGDEQPPGVRSVHNQTLQQDTAGKETKTA